MRFRYAFLAERSSEKGDWFDGKGTTIISQALSGVNNYRWLRQVKCSGIVGVGVSQSTHHSGLEGSCTAGGFSGPLNEQASWYLLPFVPVAVLPCPSYNGVRVCR